MDPTNNIFVKEVEFNEYRFTANRKNRILSFWLEIFRSMPRKLKREARLKATDLVEQSKGEFDISGVIPYQFETKASTEELKEYLDQFAVFVECTTKKLRKWREKIHTIEEKLPQK